MRKTSLVKILLIALILGAAGFVAWHQRSRRAPQVGQSAPAFSLPIFGRGSIALRDYRQRVVVLNFWATWCPPCVEEMPSLERFAEQMRDRGVTVIGVSVDRDAAALEKFVAAARLSFPIARDPDQAVASRYGTLKFPETYIIDRNGKIAEKVVGAINWQDPRIVDFVRSLTRPARSSGR